MGAWILSYFISCGIFCQSGQQEVELPTEESCLNQLKIIQDRVVSSGDTIIYLHCTRKTSSGSSNE